MASVAPLTGEAKAQACITAALAYKEAGNAFFQAGDMPKALRNYHNGHMETKSFREGQKMGGGMGFMSGPPKDPVPEEILKAVDNLHCTLLNNIAAVHFKAECWEKLERYTSQIIAVEPNNLKARYRRARAFWGLNRVSNAEEDLKVALAICPTDKDSRQLQALVDKKRKEYAAKEREMLKGMFDRMSVQP